MTKVDAKHLGMVEPPLVSVAVSVRNNQRTIARAIRSIIEQTYPHWELIVVDDGSTDETAAIVAEFAVSDPRITLVRRAESRGLAVRLNEIVAEARGKYIARMDGDDFCYPERFARQVAFLEVRPDFDLVGTGAMAFSPPGEPIGTFRLATAHADICCRPGRGFGLPHPTWMGRADWFRRFPYDPKAIRSQDQEKLLRAYSASRFANLDEVLLGYEQVTSNFGSSFASRRYYSQALLDHARRTGAWGLAATGIAEQMARAAYTWGSLKLGRSETIMRGRFAAPTAGDLQRFAEVKAGLEHPMAVNAQSGDS